MINVMDVLHGAIGLSNLEKDFADLWACVLNACLHHYSKVHILCNKNLSSIVPFCITFLINYVDLQRNTRTAVLEGCFETTVL
jgi:hypothetical protein